MLDQDLFLQRALMADGLVDRERLDAAIRFGSENDCDLVDALIRTDTLTGRQIALTKADLCEVPFVDLSCYEPCVENTTLVPRAVAERYCVYPLFHVDGVLTVAMDDPLNLEATDRLRQVTRREVDTVLSDREQVRSLIAKAYSLGHAEVTATTTEEEEIGDDEARQPIVAAVIQLLTEAVEENASDIHIGPDEHELHVRYRVDGVLRRKQGPPLSMHTGIVQRLKVMANLDLTTTRKPQDGKFRFTRGSRPVDVRMSTVPTVCGENVVLRLLSNVQQYSTFADLGIPVNIIEGFEEAIRQPYGMLLVTGPTGSGKTTTLYTALSRLNDPSRNIMTIEDPVEIRLPYVRQIQVNPEIGLVFANALRSILRQDPDVVLVGEVRDEETATIALQAALTGHLVMSTLHTNDSVGAIARLRDYGLPPFVINSAVLGVMAQRLVRRVCDHCTCSDPVDDLLRNWFAIDEGDDGFVRGAGCSRCGQTGYRGRVGIYELLRFDSNIRGLIDSGESTEVIRTAAIESGMRLMWQDGLDKARRGLTSLRELAKVSGVASTESIGRKAA